MPGALDDERPAVGADVREAVDLVVAVAGQDQRLVEPAGEEREREHLPRDTHEVVMSGVLPGAREDALALELEERGI